MPVAPSSAWRIISTTASFGPSCACAVTANVKPKRTAMKRHLYIQVTVQEPTAASNKNRDSPGSNPAREASYHDRYYFPREFRIVRDGSTSEQGGNAEDNKRKRLAGTGQFSDTCAYYSQEYKCLAFLKIGH